MRIIDASCTIEPGGVKSLLKEMDRHGIERAVIGPAKNFIAVENKRGNSYVAEAVRLHPKRLTGFAVASPWFGRRAVAELQRAFDLGLAGLKIYPAIQGFILTDPQIYPLIEFPDKARWPV